MAEVITTLHPENDETIDLYPNIKKENIPAGAIETSKIANEAVTEEKLNPALQARLTDEVVIVELSGTSGVISESSYNKLVNAEIGIIKIDNEFYYKAYIKEMGSPSYPVYHFVTLNQYAMNESNNDYLIRKDIAVNSSTRFWVKSTFLKSLSFYNEATETILIDHIDTGDLHSDGNINTDAGINAETESNIAGVVMNDGEISADEIYIGDGDRPVKATLEYLDEDANKALYHLGAFDSDDGKTRQSWEVDLSKLNWTYNTTYGYFETDAIDGIAIPSDDNTVADIISSNYTAIDRNHVDTSNNKIAVSTLGRISVYTDGQSTNLPKGLAQYKLATPFTTNDDIIEGETILPLDTNMANKIRQEVVDGLQLLNEALFVDNKGLNSSGDIVSASGFKATKEYIPIKPNTTYTLTNGTAYGYKSDKTFDSFIYNNTFTTKSTMAYIRVESTMGRDVMLTESNHSYPYSKYHGKILHQVDVEPVTLWTNPSPNADFGGQITVSDMSIYKYIVIEYKDDPASDTASKYLKVKYEALKALYIEHPDGMRLVDFINSTTIDFDATASYIIPVAIYGTNIL